MASRKAEPPLTISVSFFFKGVHLKHVVFVTKIYKYNIFVAKIFKYDVFVAKIYKYNVFVAKIYKHALSESFGEFLRPERLATSATLEKLLM